MNDFKNNPYAAPQSVDAGDGRVFRRGRKVYVPRSGDLPDWCLCCGATAVVSRRKCFRVMPIWVRVVLMVWWLLNLTGVLALFGGANFAAISFVLLLIAALVAMVLRGKVYLHLGWCAKHRRLKWWSLGLTFVGMMLIFIGIFVLMYHLQTWAYWLMVVSTLMMFVGAIWHGRYRVWVARLDDAYAVVYGAKKGFLQRLDEL